MRYSATIEYINGQGAAIVELTDDRGAWAGGGRISTRSGAKRDLYEAGYLRASACASAKGGTLDRFSEIQAP